MSWNYYLGDNDYINTLALVEHVVFGPMIDHVVDDSQFLRDLEAGDLHSVSWLIPTSSTPSTRPPARCARASPRRPSSSSRGTVRR